MKLESGMLELLGAKRRKPTFQLLRGRWDGKKRPEKLEDIIRWIKSKDEEIYFECGWKMKNSKKTRDFAWASTVFGEGTRQKSNEQSIKCQNLLKHAFFYDAYAKSREVFLDFKDAILFRIQFCACLAEEDTYPVTVRRYGRLKMCPASSGHCDSSWQNSFPWFNPIVLSRPSCWCFSFGPSFKKWNKEAFRLQM